MNGNYCEKCGSPKVDGGDLCFAHGGNEQTHTPTPWEIREYEIMRRAFVYKLYGNGDYIGETNSAEHPNEANAEFIVRAVNSHEALRTIALRHMSLNELNAEIERLNGAAFSKAESK